MRPGPIEFWGHRGTSARAVFVPRFLPSGDMEGHTVPLLSLLSCYFSPNIRGRGNPLLRVNWA